MADFHTVAKASEIPPGEMKLVELAGAKVVVANVEGTFFAFNDTCTHVGGPLSEGILEGETVTCPWHATVFNVKTGEPLEGPGEDPIRTYEVRVDGGEVQLKTSE